MVRVATRVAGCPGLCVLQLVVDGDGRRSAGRGRWAGVNDISRTLEKKTGHENQADSTEMQCRVQGESYGLVPQTVGTESRNTVRITQNPAP